MILISGLLMGLLGSMHCIGMCGPIIVVVHNNSSFFHRLMYHSGRIFIYGCLGIALGLIGKTFTIALSQQSISVFAGSIMLIFAFMPSAISGNSVFARYMGTLYYSIFNYAKPLWQSNSVYGQSIFGMVNGLLPCGFVYMALAGSLAMGSIIGSALWMIFFGIGTSVSLLLAGYITSILPVHIQKNIKKAMPIATITIAILFITRGLSLGIPYISPILPSSINMTKNQTGQNSIQMPEQHSCCVPDKTSNTK